jgi:dihydrofolate reductase
MTEIVYYVAASLDGYIATPDGGVDWLSEFEDGGGGYGYADFYASVDAVLLGRRTYEQALTFGPWPYQGKPCWVFSHGALSPATPEIIVTAASPPEVAVEMAARGIRRAWLVGGAELAASFRAAALISEYYVAVIPIILGSGIPLFAAPGPRARLALVESTPYANGIVMLHYRNRPPDAPAGQTIPPTGGIDA